MAETRKRSKEWLNITLKDDNSASCIVCKITIPNITLASH